MKLFTGSLAADWPFLRARRRRLIGLLHDRLDKRFARSSSNFDESGGIVTAVTLT